MIKLGATARLLRDRLGISQREAATALGITSVHLCNIENEKSDPSNELVDRYLELWGVDLYVMAWCNSRDSGKLPKSMRAIAAELGGLWAEEIEHAVTKWKKTATRHD